LKVLLNFNEFELFNPEENTPNPTTPSLSLPTLHTLTDESKALQCLTHMPPPNFIFLSFPFILNPLPTGWLENPAFYTAVFFLCPLVILVGGAATGVIPGFVPNTYEYSTMEEVKSSFSYGDLTQAAEYASGASSLF